MEKLKAALSFGGILSPQDITSLAGDFRRQTQKPGEFIQEQHAVATQIVFVDKGILRVYGVYSESTEVTKHFVRENQFFANLESYYSQKPATEAIQSVVSTQLYTISFSVFEKHMAHLPNLFIFFKTISEATLLNKIKDNDFLNFGDAKTKYQEFVRRYPEVARQVPQQYIASYLKITPQSLSRIRKELSQQGDV